MGATVSRLDALEAEPHATVFDDAEPRTVRLRLPAGESLPSHTHPDRTIVFHLLAGTLELDVGAETYTLSAGDVARFDGDQPIEPRAVEDSTALLVLAPTTD